MQIVDSPIGECGYMLWKFFLNCFLCDFYFKYCFLIIIIFAEQLIILFNRNIALKRNNIIKLLN